MKIVDESAESIGTVLQQVRTPRQWSTLIAVSERFAKGRGMDKTIQVQGKTTIREGLEGILDRLSAMEDAVRKRMDEVADELSATVKQAGAFCRLAHRECERLLEEARRCAS